MKYWGLEPHRGSKRALPLSAPVTGSSVPIRFRFYEYNLVSDHSRGMMSGTTRSSWQIRRSVVLFTWTCLGSRHSKWAGAGLKNRRNEPLVRIPRSSVLNGRNQRWCWTARERICLLANVSFSVWKLFCEHKTICVGSRAHTTSLKCKNRRLEPSNSSNGAKNRTKKS